MAETHVSARLGSATQRIALDSPDLLWIPLAYDWIPLAYDWIPLAHDWIPLAHDWIIPNSIMYS